ncbi:MAG: sulfatase-like hydrolase/transferase [Myxococcota bacterium]|nr:sulfatase-like hydrolase/transferase [Myxococcota bacterium]
MTRTWFLRVLRGGGAGLLLGAVLGGFEVLVALHSSVTVMANGLQRLQLWGSNALLCGLLGAVVGLASSAVLGSVLGHDQETRDLAIDTGRDPRHPWLPWTLGAALLVVLAAQVLPTVWSGRAGEGGRPVLVVGLVFIAAGVLSIVLRFWLKRVDTTGRGAGVAVLGLPTLLVLTMSAAVSTSMAGGDGTVLRGGSGTMNVLLVTVDGLRADHAGPGSRVRTPAMRWMAQEGVRFTQAVTPATAEAPPVAALMTGRHPLSTGFLVDGQSLASRLPGEGTGIPTLAGIFAAEGYATGAFVSSAALDGRDSGLARGFGVYDDEIEEGLRGSARLALPTLLRWSGGFGQATPSATTVLRPAALTFERFDTWLSYHYRENFFAWVHVAEPRIPFLAGTEDDSALVDPFPGERGHAMGARVANLDAMLASVFRSFESDGLLQNTLIVVVGSRGLVPGARPTVDEGWVHVPALLYGRALEGPIVVEQQVRLQDLAPTILSLAGFPRSTFGDGTSLVPLLRGRSMPAPQAISVGPPRGGPDCAVSLRTPQWKFLRDSAGVQHWYELDEDPRELIDRKEDRPKEFEAAARSLEQVLGGAWPRARRAALDPGRASQLRALDAAR